MTIFYLRHNGDELVRSASWKHFDKSGGVCFVCLNGGGKRDWTEHPPYLCLAPLTEGEGWGGVGRKSVTEIHNCLVLLDFCVHSMIPLCVRHSSECMLAQQTLIVWFEGSKQGWMNACFSVSQTTTMNICLNCRPHVAHRARPKEHVRRWMTYIRDVQYITTLGRRSPNAEEDLYSTIFPVSAIDWGLFSFCPPV